MQLNPKTSTIIDRNNKCGSPSFHAESDGTTSDPIIKSGENSFDPLRLLSLIIIYKWSFLTVLVTLSALALLFGLSRAPEYSSSMEIYYNESVINFAEDAKMPILKNELDQNLWLSIMRSGQMNEMIAKKSDLNIGESDVKGMVSFDIIKSKNSSSPMFMMSVTSPVAQVIPIIAQSAIESLNELLCAEINSNNKKLIDFLHRQVADKNREMAQIDRELFGSALEGNYVQDSKNIIKELDRLRIDLMNARIDLATITSSRIRAQKELSGMDGTIVNESAFSEPLKVQLMNLKTELARALTKNREDHPIVRSIRDNIAQVNKMLMDSLEQNIEIKSLMENPLKRELLAKLLDMQIEEEALITKKESIEKMISNLEKMVRGDSSNESQQQLLRKREQLAEGITMLSSKIIDYQMAGQASLSRFMFVDEPATPESPSAKRRLIIIGGGILFALFAAAGFIILIDFIDDRYKVPGDFKSRFNIKLIGSIAARGRRAGFEESEFEEIALKIRQSINNNGSHIFSLISAERGEGKTLMACMVARTLADKGLKILVIDTDSFMPAMSRYFDMESKFGWLNLINEQLSWSDVIHQTTFENLFITPVGHMEYANGHYAYSGKSTDEFFSFLKSEFDVVLIDTPAILPVPEVVLSLERSDSLIIVIRMQKSSIKASEKLLEMIKNHHSRVMGAIINYTTREIGSRDYYYYKKRYY